MQNPIIARLPELAAWTNNLKSYEDLNEFSINRPDLFWGAIARKRIEWIEDFQLVCNTNNLASFDDPYFRIKWFISGKLNVTVNCVDVNYIKNPDRVALIWEKDEPGAQEYFTYRDLYRTMNRIANMFKHHGIKKGDCVALYVHTSTYAVAAMLACARIGAIHMCIYAEFPPHAIAMRINEVGCVALITDNQGRRNGKSIDLKKIADEAIKLCPTIRVTFVIDRTVDVYETTSTVINLRREILRYATTCNAERMDSEDPLFIICTSGSTGKPKALVHTQAGFLLLAKFSEQQSLTHGENSTGLFTGDIAWIGSHVRAVYGPLSAGNTSILFDSTFTYPNLGRLWETVQRFKVTNMGLHPFVCRILMKQGSDCIGKYDLSTLKLIHVGGESLDDNVLKWLYNATGKVQLMEGWGSTEFVPSLSHRYIRFDQHGEVIASGMRPNLGTEIVVLDDYGNELPKTCSYGHFCIKTVFPGMARTMKNNHEAYCDAYFTRFPGYFYTGDHGGFDSRGLLTIAGREDDLIKTRGMRIGAGEIEEVINLHKLVIDSAAVGISDELVGSNIFVFLVAKVKSDSEEEQMLLGEIKELVETKIAKFGLPTFFLIVDDLPKTRSGKMMRRLLRNIAANKYDNLGDLSSIENISCLRPIISKHAIKYGQAVK